jgi:hypothetical protein
MPNKRKMKAIVSTANVEPILKEMFTKVEHVQQRQCVLLIDEVKIRPSIAYSGSVLNGLAQNDPSGSSKASSMLGVMVKCLYGGPSLMTSIIPVHKLTAEYQFSVVTQAAAVVQNSGGVVIGSITDNHKINQKFCGLFKRKNNHEAVHPLHANQVWYLLYDSVHLLKCLRNNWITEKSQKISFDGHTVGSFVDVKELYEAEKSSILKTTSLTSSSVYPTRLQLQNVKHVLKVFSDKVVAGLKLRNKPETANFIQQVVTLWKMLNVSSLGEDKRFNDPARSAHNVDGLQRYLKLFEESISGHGSNRICCLTHDTRKAMVQTLAGFIAMSRYLFSVGFDYVLLGSLQNDRIEGEFSVYRQSTGANMFMTSKDVLSAYKKRLARFSARNLDVIHTDTALRSHSCDSTTLEEAVAIERAFDTDLSTFEEYSAAYVAGWLEHKCKDISFDDEDSLLTDEVKSFILEVSRGKLTVPHSSTYELVRAGLSYVKSSQVQLCCRTKLVTVLEMVNDFFEFGCFSFSVFNRLANVLLNGVQKLDQDTQSNSVLYQTSIKKARLS